MSQPLFRPGLPRDVAHEWGNRLPDHLIRELQSEAVLSLFREFYFKVGSVLLSEGPTIFDQISDPLWKELGDLPAPVSREVLARAYEAVRGGYVSAIATDLCAQYASDFVVSFTVEGS